MGGAAGVTGLTVLAATRSRGRVPLTGDACARRVRTFDRNVLVGGGIFGIGWGLSGICPGAACASLGGGNLPILYGIAGMFLGAYAQGVLRAAFAADGAADAAGAD